MMGAKLRKDAPTLWQIAKRGKLTAADRRWLRVTLANIKVLEFVKL